MLSSILKAVSVGIVAAISGIVVAILGIIAIFFFAIFGALIGAFSGWMVSLAPYLGGWVVEGFRSFGVQNPNLVCIGAALGFVAGFFKSSNSGQKWN